MADRTCVVGGCTEPHYNWALCRSHVTVYRGLSRVEQLLFRTERVGDCRIWRGSRRHEYGEVEQHGKNYYVHRVMYELLHGPIPEGLGVRHTCDTQLCIAPTHLVLGTQAENVADMGQRKRWRNQFTAGVGNDPSAWTRSKSRKVLKVHMTVDFEPICHIRRFRFTRGLALTDEWSEVTCGHCWRERVKRLAE